jgi:hypothetical protein
VWWWIILGAFVIAGVIWFIGALLGDIRAYDDDEE